VNGTDPTGMSGNPVDVDCSGGGTAASCAGAEAIAAQVTAEECANDPGACGNGGGPASLLDPVEDAILDIGDYLDTQGFANDLAEALEGAESNPADDAEIVILVIILLG
jgi:hypothetical protein